MKSFKLTMLALATLMSHQVMAVNCPMPFTHEGTDGDETVDANGGTGTLNAATTGRDLIHMWGGNDTVYALAGDDCIDGGNQDDYIEGGDGRDWLFGAQGRDILYGGADNDYVSGGNDNDVLHGGEGHDDMYGGAGNDEMYGTAGNNTMYGDGGNDSMTGGPGEDIMYGGDGFDTLISGGGYDQLDGGTGYDKCYGGYTNVNCANVPDTQYLSIPVLSQMDFLDAGPGNDILTLHSGTKAMAIGGEGDDVFRFKNHGNTAGTFIKIIDSSGDNRLEFPQAYSSDVAFKQLANGDVTAYHVGTGHSLMTMSETTLNSFQAIKFEDATLKGNEVLRAEK